MKIFTNKYLMYAMFAVSTLISVTSISAAPPVPKLNAEQIVEKANHMSLYQGNDCKGKIELVITDKQGRTRKRQINILRKNNDNTDMNQMYFAYFYSPADVRKMVFMVHKNAQQGKDDDRWLYLPSLDLVKRIAASDKRTSFAGSDFLYEDISGRSTNADHHELLETESEFFVIKNTPKNKKEVEFDYYVAYIDKQNFIPMKIEYFKPNNTLYRVMEVLEITNISANKNDSAATYPTVTKSAVSNIESNSTSVMKFSKIKYNQGLKDNLFTERYLRRPPKSAMR